MTDESRSGACSGKYMRNYERDQVVNSHLFMDPPPRSPLFTPSSTPVGSQNIVSEIARCPGMRAEDSVQDGPVRLNRHFATVFRDGESDYHRNVKCEYQEHCGQNYER